MSGTRTIGKDLAAVCCFFNPCRWNSRVRNYHEFRQGIERTGLRLLTVELAFGDAPFELPEDQDTLRIRGGDVMWQKERLWQVGGERLLEEGYGGIAFLDADILFHEDDWPGRVVAGLVEHPVVQCFSDTRKNYTGEVRHLGGVVMSWRRDGRIPDSSKGFAWAMRGEVFREAGLYQHCVVGGGDSALALGALGIAHGPRAWEDLLSEQNFVCRSGLLVLAHYQDWAGRFYEAAGGPAGYVEGLVEALPHGLIESRRYRDRHEILAGFDPEKEVEVDGVGVFVWTGKGEARREAVVRYFLSRDEDR